MTTENPESKKSSPETESDEVSGSPGMQDRDSLAPEAKTKKTKKSSPEAESDEGSRSPGVQDRGI